MKAGLMEIADIFVVNKSDRPDADVFVNNLRLMLAPAFHSHQHEVAIVKTIASQQKELTNYFKKLLNTSNKMLSMINVIGCLQKKLFI